MSTVITLASTIVAKSYIGKVKYFFSQKFDLSGDPLSSTKNASIFFYGLGVSYKFSVSNYNESIFEAAEDKFQQPNIQLFAELLAKTSLRTLVVTRCKRVVAHSPRRWGPTSVVEVKTRCCNLQSEFISYKIDESMMQVKTRFVSAYSALRFAFRDMEGACKPPKWLYWIFAVNQHAKSLNA